MSFDQQYFKLDPKFFLRFFSFDQSILHWMQSPVVFLPIFSSSLAQSILQWTQRILKNYNLSEAKCNLDDEDNGDHIDDDDVFVD